MPWWQESDTFHDDPVWGVLAGGRLDMLDRLQAAYARLKSHAARHRSDGFLTMTSALSLCHGRQGVLDLLASQPLADAPPLLHRPEDECDCLGEWREGYDLRMHRFLVRNPSRRENDRHRTQERERRDARIRNVVYTRDGGCCRFCGSGPIKRKGMARARDLRRALELDHVDPDQPAGPDLANLVTACKRCNQHKGKRTPAEADMVLLPVPTPAEATALLARPEELHDLPVVPLTALLASADGAPASSPAAETVNPDIDNDNDNAATTHATTGEALSRALSSPLSAAVDVDVGEGPEDATSTAQPCPEPHADMPRQRPESSGSCVGSGGVGTPPRSGCPEGSEQPPRGPTETDIYHRRSRGPAP